MRIPNEARKAAVNNTMRKEFFQLANQELNGMLAVGFFRNGRNTDVEDLIFEGKHIKVLPVKVRMFDKVKKKEFEKKTGFFAAFDVDNIELNSVVEIKVPKGRVSMFVGKDAWQLRQWCKKLGIKRINVVETA